MIKRFLLVEVNVGDEEGSNPGESVPTIQDWATYKTLLRRIVRDQPSSTVRVHAVYDLSPAGMMMHRMQGYASSGPVIVAPSE